MTTISEHELTMQLHAGAVDSKAGVLRGVTVAQAGVEATGKFVFLDKDGNLTRDPKLAARKLKVVTDEQTLDTIMAAADMAGGVLKARSDHDDSLEARAGYADNFKKVPAGPEVGSDKVVPARVICDLHLNDSYRDRDVVLETAAKTPKLIGLSIDMLPEFEIFKDRALMRISELYGVDIVDEGAITHDGLFLNRSVDKTPRLKTAKPESLQHMASDDKKTLTIDDCMAAINKLGEAMTALQAAVAPKKTDGDGDAMAKMAAQQKETAEKLAAVTEGLATLQKEAAALGLKKGDAKGGSGGADAAAETEAQRLAAEKAKGEKSYLQIVDETVAASNGKLKRSDAHRQVMASHPEKYAEHQRNLGVYDASKDNTLGNAKASR
jgi:hypothetical protein